MKKLFLALVLGLCLLPILSFAIAGDAGAAAVPDAGLVDVDPRPSATLDDPLVSPAAAWDDLRAARKTGWALALLGGLIMLTRTAASASSRYSWLAWLAKGKAAIGVSAALALFAAAFDTVALGGSWVAAAIAGGGAVLALLMPTTKPPVPTLPAARALA